MKVKTFKKFKLVLFVFLLVAVVFAILFKSPLIALLSSVIYMWFSSLLSLRVEGVLADERQITIGEKASQTSFKILIPMLFLTSLFLMTAGGEEEFFYLNSLGVILAYITCLGIAVYVVTYLYFDKKTGGR